MVQAERAELVAQRQGQTEKRMNELDVPQVERASATAHDRAAGRLDQLEEWLMLPGVH
jgi:hypothetical protein